MSSSIAILFINKTGASLKLELEDSTGLASRLTPAIPAQPPEHWDHRWVTCPSSCHGNAGYSNARQAHDALSCLPAQEVLPFHVNQEARHRK